MPRNDAQMAAAQTATQRKTLATREPVQKGLAAGVREDAVKDLQRGSTNEAMFALFGGPRKD